MDDRITQAWLDAAHAEFNQQERIRLEEMAARGREMVASGWSDRWIAMARNAKATAEQKTLAELSGVVIKPVE